MNFNWIPLQSYQGIGIVWIKYFPSVPPIPPIPTPPVVPYDLTYLRRYLQDGVILQNIGVQVVVVPTFPDCGYLTYLRRYLN